VFANRKPAPRRCRRRQLTSAWTPKAATGFALIAKQGPRSFAADAGAHGNSASGLCLVLERATIALGGSYLDLVTIDMPLARSPIRGRRPPTLPSPGGLGRQAAQPLPECNPAGAGKEAYRRPAKCRLDLLPRPANVGVEPLRPLQNSLQRLMEPVAFHAGRSCGEAGRKQWVPDSNCPNFGVQDGSSGWSNRRPMYF
jgi:hypothetical protein